MSTSDTDLTAKVPRCPTRRSLADESRTGRLERRAMVVYTCATAFCVLLEIVYARFGHGVHSPYMTWLFLYPLLGGVGLFGFLYLFAKDRIPRLSYDLYNAGLATLAVGSLLHGIFAIAGTASAYQIIFTIAGSCLIAACAISWVVGAGGRQRRA